MLGNLTGWHALILIAIVLLIFGAARLPALAKSVGQSVKILRKETAREPAPVVHTSNVDLPVDPEPLVASAAVAPAGDSPNR